MMAGINIKRTLCAVLVVLVVIPGALVGAIYLHVQAGPQDRPLTPAEAQEARARQAPDPTPEQVAQLTQEVGYMREQADLEQQLYFIHDNRGSDAEQCVLIRRLRLSAQEARNSADYRKWSDPNADELLYERDVEKAGLPLHSKSKADDKRRGEIAERGPGSCS